MRKEIGAALLASFALTSFSQVAREKYLPNIIINYADDPGYGDLSCYGQRVPCIMRWPGVISEGMICNRLASAIDILPTIAAITGSALPEKKIDGVSLLPLLLGDSQAMPRHEFYYYYQQNTLEAVQKEYWKLVLPHKGISYVGVVPGKDGWHGKNYKH